MNSLVTVNTIVSHKPFNPLYFAYLHRIVISHLQPMHHSPTFIQIMILCLLFNELMINMCRIEPCHLICFPNQTRIDFLNTFSVYLDCILSDCHSISLNKLRCSSHRLAIEEGRYRNIARPNRVCTNCSMNVFQRSTFVGSDFCRLLSVLLGHSVFSSPPQRPMTSDFEGFSIQLLSITFIFLSKFLRKSQYFPFQCSVLNKGTTWYHCLTSLV